MPSGAAADAVFLRQKADPVEEMRQPFAHDACAVILHGEHRDVPLPRKRDRDLRCAAVAGRVYRRFVSTCWMSTGSIGTSITDSAAAA